MRQYTLSEPAKADLESALAYIASHNEQAAERMRIKIEEKLSILSRSPEMGESYEVGGLAMRRCTVRPYVLFYQSGANGLYVYRILHGARDADSLLD